MLRLYPKAQELKFPLLLIVVHIPLGIVLYRSNLLTFLHPVIVFCLGLYYAARKNEKIEKAAFVAAYIVGAEVLWRMAGSPIFWEFGKYSVMAIMLMALIRRNCWKIPSLPLLYLVLLIPACLLTLATESLGDAKDKISFNMSGPVLLFVSCWFFSSLKLNQFQLKRFFLFLILPVISIAIVSLFYTVTIENIQFNNESNSATSGGYGPNQVSSMLGLGVFVCIAAYLLLKNNLKETLSISVLILLFAAQSVLTFSRGGMYNAIAAALGVVFFQMQNFNQTLRRLFPVFGIGVVFLLLVFPYLNDFTGGNLQARFEDTGTTGRLDIIEADYQIFLDNPLLGAGVGEAKALREEYFGTAVGAHTEFARLVSEHGMFGILSIIVLGLFSIYSIKQQKLNIGKAVASGAIIWSAFFMLNAGMRLAAPSVLWGLCYLTIIIPQLKRKKLFKPLKYSPAQTKIISNE